MTVSCDFRDLLAKSVILGTRVWEFPESLAPPEMVRELAALGDEATFLNTLGLSLIEDRGCLSQFRSFLNSNEVDDTLVHAGERWHVKSVINVADEKLQAIGKSLAEDSTPARVGRLLRALPVMAGSKFTLLGERLALVLGVHPVPEALLAAYSDAFSRGDEEILAAVDRVILDDQVMGPVAAELASRLMLKLGCDSAYLSKEGRDALISCLALLISSMIEKAGFPSTGTDEQNTGRR